ncbi:translation elongation factor Ts [Caldinitratiruptor microaerophilus]|uniref:Elongation factor Ts n=1 Tax=Caldinitratiruptor microaerophilus TaxID=671077 RepID=A0AA35CJ88_9FIRM|nr:translation elongation factor Ts [Caldinitratiruptor microaerophilus]BDG59378.1 elongation factor Ts [Caldinitratiruptor microaerophilus]
MAGITAAQVKELRERTGAGMMDCKRALEEAGGDMERAVDILRERGLAQAAKKAGRVAAEGLVAAHVAPGGEVGALVEVNCETDFVARNEEFQSFARTVAELAATRRPADTDALLQLPYPGAGGTTVGDFQKGLIAKIGENQAVRRMALLEAPGGLVHRYVHGGTDAGRVGVLVAVTGGKGEAAEELAHEVALQIASMRPQYLRRDEVPEAVLEHEREVERARARSEGKPEARIPQIVEGRIGKFLKEVVLLEQAWVKDDKKTIAQLIEEYARKAGQPLAVQAFVRFEVGEGQAAQEESQ